MATDTPEFMLLASLRAFHAARQRYLDTAAIRRVAQEEVFLPPTETLWWAYSVDEGFGRLPLTKSSYTGTTGMPTRTGESSSGSSTPATDAGNNEPSPANSAEV